MTTIEYLQKLEQCLQKIPMDDRQEMLRFYQEFLEDGGDAAMEELGTPETLAQRILQENGYTESTPTQVRPDPKKRSISHIIAIWTLVILSSPIWLSLLVAFFSVMLSLLIVVAVIPISLAAAAVCSIGYGTIMLFHMASVGIFGLGVGLFCAGLTILLAIPCWIAVKALCAAFATVLKNCWKITFGKEY